MFITIIPWLPWLLVTPIVAILLKYVYHLLNLHCYPPGPFPIPFLGNLHLLTEKPHQEFEKISKVYGDVYSFSMGSKRAVIVNSYESFKEALVKKSIAFAGRQTDNFLIRVYSRDYIGIIFADYGPVWSIARKLGHSALNMYGEHASLSETLMEEADALEGRLREAKGEPVDVEIMMGTHMYYLE